MELLNYIKIYPSIQVAHLYEHLFCDELFRQLHAKSLHSYIDYQIEANTYYRGFILMEVYVRQDIRDEVSALIKNVQIEINEKSIEIGLAQLSSEKECVMRGEMNGIRAMLHELNAMSWEQVDTFSVYDSFKVRHPSFPLFATDAKLSTRKVNIEIILEKQFYNENRRLAPLFYAMAYGFLGDTSDMLQEKYAYHIFDDQVQDTNGLSLRNKFRFVSGCRQDVGVILHDSENVITKIVRNGSLERFVNLLQSQKYLYRNPFIDERHIFEVTGVLTGFAGWKEIASMSNVLSILQKTQLKVSMGRSVEILPLSEVIKN